MRRVSALMPAALSLALLGSAAPALGQGLLDRAARGISDAADAVGETVDRQLAPTPAAEIEREVDAAYGQLLASSPEMSDLADKSVAVLVFPTVTKGGFMIGGQYGEGAMLQGGETTGYYSLAGVSYGLQIGGQQFSYAMFFLNEAALQHFRDNNGWEAGSGPTLVGGREGWSASMGTNNLQGDIVPVFYGQAGLMAGLGLQGTKITKLAR